ncbi:O-antigen ligase family protein [Paraburkholderia flava]|uniref:O-antigen ligase family protein n=1 Tax=Paraburkholderia flava TaxID=2547393 RepID=UPI0010605990|nr:O-antigen ligase family protein [Paraburkholderia flava]
MSSYVLHDGNRLADRVTRQATTLSTTFIWGLLAIGLVLSPIGDFLSVRASQGGLVMHSDDARFSLLIRGAMVAGLMAAMLWGFRMRMSGLRLSALALLAVLSTSITYAVGDMSDRECLEQAVFIFKIFSFFVYLGAMSKLSDGRLAKLESIVCFVLLVYAAAIVAGAAFSVDMFRSYQDDTHIRSGYKGIVYAQNEAAALVIVGLAFGYLQVLQRGWRLSSILLVGGMLLASMLTGTKGAVVGALGVTCAYYFGRYNVLKATLRACAVIGVLMTAAVLAYLLVQQVHEAVELSLRYFQHQGGRIGTDKLLTLLLSGRNLKFANVWADLSQQNYISLLTGGYPVVRYMVEIDIPDLILVLGLPVFVVYFVALFPAFVHRRGRNPVLRFGTLFFCVLMAVAATAGHVLGSAVIGPYLAIIAVLLARSVKPNRRFIGDAA